MDKILMVRTVGGEFIMGTEDTATVVDSNGNQTATNDSKIRLKDARIFNVQMTSRGAAIAFIPPFPFTKSPVKELENLEIDKSAIILLIEEKYIDSEIVNGYKSNISGIDLSASNKNNIII